MATNKHATIRYQALDRCFGNFSKKYFIENLVEACNTAIYNYAGSSEGIQKRQVFDDIKFMESHQGWSIPLERVKEGRRVYYRYSEKHFSISNKGISPLEAEQLQQTLAMLSRFTGLPQFEWVREIQVRLENTFNLAGSPDAVVTFEQNPYLKGLDHFYNLFQAIRNKQSLYIEYQGFQQVNPVNIHYHPWHLKQYNSRWFLYGLNQELGVLTNLALDRILTIETSNIEFIENTEYDFSNLFEDVVGVSVNPEKESRIVELKIENTTWPYVESKPIHGSQRIIRRTENSVIIQLEVQLNHELNALLFSFMGGVEVIKPEELRRLFQNQSRSIYKQYN